MRRLIHAAAFAAVLAIPASAPAGLLSDLSDELDDFVDAQLEDLRDTVDRVERKRVRALEKVDRLLGKETRDLKRDLASAKRVAATLERTYPGTSVDDQRAIELLRGLLDELDAEVAAVQDDTALGAAALDEMGHRSGRRALRTVQDSVRIAESAGLQALQRRRARLLDRAGRQIDRAQRWIRKAGGVTGPYTCAPSETGTAAGAVRLDLGGAATRATNIDGLLTLSASGISSLDLDATEPGGTAVRLSFAPNQVDGPGTFAVGPGVGAARAEVEDGGGLRVATSGQISIEHLDLEAKTLFGVFELALDGGGTATGSFTICDILIVR